MSQVHVWKELKEKYAFILWRLKRSLNFYFKDIIKKRSDVWLIIRNILCLLRALKMVLRLFHMAWFMSKFCWGDFSFLFKCFYSCEIFHFIFIVIWCKMPWLYHWKYWKDIKSRRILAWLVLNFIPLSLGYLLVVLITIRLFTN